MPFAYITNDTAVFESMRLGHKVDGRVASREGCRTSGRGGGRHAAARYPVPIK